VLDAGDELVASTRTPALAAYGTRQIRLKGSGGTTTPFVTVVADANNVVVEGDEENNVAWQRVGS